MLSNAEAAVYDRQIRLWGVSGQFAIKKATTLVIGLTPAAVETCKNLILAGSNLAILETGESEGSNFLIKLEGIPDEVGSVAVRTAAALRGLNPMANIHVVDSHEHGNFDIALVSLNIWSVEKTAALKMSNLIATVETLSGTFSFLTCDGHIVSETSKPTDALPAVISSIDFSQLCMQPIPRATRKDVHMFRDALSFITKGDGLDLAGASPAVAAITGGLLAEECLKIFTQKDFPLLNTITVDGESCSASVRQVGECAVVFKGTVVEDVEIVGGSDALALD